MCAMAYAHDNGHKETATWLRDNQKGRGCGRDHAQLSL
jgi:hypothetical protein